MASVQFVKAVAVMIGGNVFAECPQAVQIECDNSKVEGTAWLVPVVRMGRVISYDVSLAASKPSPDSIHCVRIKDRLKEQTYFIVIADNADESVFIDQCNACCGDTPAMPYVSIPVAYAEESPCPDADGYYEFLIPMPSNPNSLKYLLPLGVFNGAAASVTPSGSGYASTAALLTFLNTATTGWGDYGTWSYLNSNKTLKLRSNVVKTAAVQVSLLTVSYCMQVQAADKIANGILIGGVQVAMDQITFKDTTAQVLVDAIKKFLVGTVEIVNDSGNTFVKYTGVQVPAKLQYNEADISGVNAFTTGACP